MNYVEQFVSGARIADRIAALAKIGGDPRRGMHRLPFSPEHRAARELFASWLRNLGMTVQVDGGGNLIGRREGTDSAAPVVMSGSHLDTQPGGGRFDGIAGVVAALEAVEAMAAAGFVHRYPIEIVEWAGEEASGRFDLTMIGSRAMIGALTDADLAARCRFTGRTLRELMVEMGIDVAALATAERPPGSVRAVVELHIEQGPYLERAGKQIGVVTGVAGATRVPCVFRGQQAHSGGMPMDARRDALCGAAELLLAAEAAARAHVDPPVVATVGYLEYGPRAIAIVPGQARVIVDVRSIDPVAAGQVIIQIEDAAQEITNRRGLDLEWGPIWGVPPTTLENNVVETIAQACDELGLAYQRMPSGGGHDAMTLGRRFSAGMIFVPSVGGISHAPEEYTRIEDLEAGAKVLCRTLRRLAV